MCQTCSQCSRMAAGNKRRGLAFYVPTRILYMFLVSKYRVGECRIGIWEVPPLAARTCQPCFCDQDLVFTQSVTSEYSTTSQYLSALLGRLGRVKSPLIDHLVMREFVSGPPSCCSIHKRVRDRKPSLMFVSSLRI